MCLQFLRVTFDPDTGLLNGLSNLKTKQTIKLRQNFYWSVSPQNLRWRICCYFHDLWLLQVQCQRWQQLRQWPAVRRLHLQTQLLHAVPHQQDGPYRERSGRRVTLLGCFVHSDECLCPSEARGAGSEAAFRSLGVSGGPPVPPQQSCGARVDCWTTAHQVSMFLPHRTRCLWLARLLLSCLFSLRLSATTSGKKWSRVWIPASKLLSTSTPTQTVARCCRGSKLIFKESPHREDITIWVLL